MLNAEIERLRESVAVSTRFAGEMRKRESVALESLEKAAAQLASMSDSSRPVAAVERKIGPVVDSGRIAAAKAEVIRLVELNKQKLAEIPVAAAPVIIEETPTIIEEAPAAIEEIPATLEPIPTSEEEAPEMIEEAFSNIEEAPTLSPEPVAPKEEATAPKKLQVAGELFALD